MPSAGLCGGSGSRRGGDSSAQDAGVYRTDNCVVLCKNYRRFAEATLAVGILGQNLQVECVGTRADSGSSWGQ